MTEQNIALGAAATVAAIVGYGSAYVPIKRFETKDGIFASFIITTGALIPYLISAFIYESLSIYPVAMLAGVIGAIGSSLCVFIMNGLGMAAGALLWNISMCLCGWAVPRFGLLGFKPQVPVHNLVNALGVCVIIFGGVCCSFVQSTPNRQQRKVAPLPVQKRVAGAAEFVDCEEATVPPKADSVTLKRKILSILAACVTGVCYGNAATPLNFLTRSAKEGRQQWPSFFLPDPLASSCSLHALLRRRLHDDNHAHFCHQLHLQIIALPLSTVCPSIVASMWSVFLFKEIKGRQNLLILAAAISVTAVGAVMITLSKF